MSIDDQGFLSPDVEQFRQEIRARLADYFSLAEKVLRLCHAHKFRFQAHNLDPQEIFTAGLVLKLIADLEGVLLLLERGMYSQCRSMLRVAIECYITLAKVCDSFEFGKAYAIVAEQARLKLIRGLRNTDEYPDVKTALTDEYVQDLEDRLRGKPRKSLEDWASGVKLEGLYQGPYRLFSADVHSDASTLSRFYVLNNSREIVSIQFGPVKPEDCRAELLEIARLCFGAVERTSVLFSLKPPDETKALVEEYERLNSMASTDRVKY